MPANPNLTTLRHVFVDGWRPDYPPSADVQLDQAGGVRVPYMTMAENLLFGPNGDLQKIPGTGRVNSAALESGATVTGAFDYWQLGTGGSSTQRRIVNAGTKIKADAADGTFSDIQTGMVSGAVPTYCPAGDGVIIATDGGDVPQFATGATCAALGGTPPTFKWAVKHKNRIFAGGINTAPSDVYYTVFGNHADWAGAGSGKFTVESSDGDDVIGAASHKGALIIFKGRQRGSIHVLTGSAPTGDDAFALAPFQYDVGAVAHNAIFPFGNDLGFMSPSGAIHTLSATQAYGSFSLGALTLGINETLHRRLNFSVIKNASVRNDWIRSRVYATMAVDGSSTNNLILVLDYRFSPPRASYITAFTAASLALVKDATDGGRPVVMFGGHDGYLRKFTTTSAIDGATAISFRATSPFINYATPHVIKTITGCAVTVQPKNQGSFTFRWQRDNQAQQSATLTQGGGVGLDTFVLDTDTLGGSRNSDRFNDGDMLGEYRSIAFDILQETLNQDFAMTGFLTRNEVGGESYESV